VDVIALILAAGKGTRMRSDLAKVLHLFLGEPLIVHPLRAAQRWGAKRAIVVVGHQAEDVEAAVEAWRPEGWPVAFALQAEQRGTGHAVLCALEALGEFEGGVLILSGDVPLLSPDTLGRLASACERSSAKMALVGFRPADPTGYGRILRDEQGRARAIREQRDASEAERAIVECNAGVYCVLAEHLRRELPLLGQDNAAGEIYLTDLLALRARAGEVAVIEVDALEVAGVNTPEQLAELELAARTR
jgi:bifunctional UDP-N-acetylglucosamine pyrophosphorylase/glucosamine-1-phosphate N-acetyltransferase